jgi:hypothetical protein
LGNQQLKLLLPLFLELGEGTNSQDLRLSPVAISIAITNQLHDTLLLLLMKVRLLLLSEKGTLLRSWARLDWLPATLSKQLLDSQTSRLLLLLDVGAGSSWLQEVRGLVLMSCSGQLLHLHLLRRRKHQLVSHLLLLQRPLHILLLQ